MVADVEGSRYGGRISDANLVLLHCVAHGSATQMI